MASIIHGNRHIQDWRHLQYSYRQYWTVWLILGSEKLVLRALLFVVKQNWGQENED